MLSEFGVILVFISTVVVFLLITFLLSRILRTDKPNPVKLSTYESGEESVGQLQSTFNPKYYVIALAFLLFEVELVLLFPWATVFADKHLIEVEGKAWFWMAFVELVIFLALLALGLAYIWKKGHFDWGQKQVNQAAEIPKIYQDFNNKMSTSN